MLTRSLSISPYDRTLYLQYIAWTTFITITIILVVTGIAQQQQRVYWSRNTDTHHYDTSNTCTLTLFVTSYTVFSISSSYHHHRHSRYHHSDFHLPHTTTTCTIGTTTRRGTNQNYVGMIGPVDDFCGPMIRRHTPFGPRQRIIRSSLFMTSEPTPPSSSSLLSLSANHDKTNGILVLLTVPLAWGTFEVAVRYVYSVQPALPSLLFSLSYYAVATIALWIIHQVMMHHHDNSAGDNTMWQEQTSNPNVIAMNQSDDRPMNHQNADDTTTTTTGMTSTTPTPSEGLLRVPTKKESGMLLSKSSSSTLVVSPPSPKLTHATVSTTSTTSHRIRIGGIELGTYLFIGNLFQLLGLLTVSSDRAAFLLQLTTIFVPLVSTFYSSITMYDPSNTSTCNNDDDDDAFPHRNTSISIQMWSACCIALLGVGIMSLHNSDALAEENATTAIVNTDGGSIVVNTVLSQFHWSMGDTFVVLAAMAYTFHCIRLEVFAKLCDNAVELGSYKAATEMVWTMISILAVIFVSQTIPDAITLTDQNDFIRFMVTSGHDIQHYWATLSEQPLELVESVPVWLVILWTGLIPIAYTITAQTYGQRRVIPVTANLIYTIQPLGTAFFAYIVLHETLGLWGYIGGLIIGLAVLLIVTEETPAALPAYTAKDD